MTRHVQSAIRNPKSAIAVALSTLGILIATLHSAGTELPPGWSLTLTSGDTALAELIQNLLLFIPLGVSLVMAGVRPLRAVAIGAGLSMTVEFLQQWIPGRDPSLGDIICNANSTAIGVALVVFAPRWLWPIGRRAAWQALATAGLAVLVWLGTGAVLRPIFPDPPYQDVWTPDWHYWGHYEGKVVAASLGSLALSQRTIEDRDPSFMPLRVTVAAASRPPGRDSPLIAILDSNGAKVVVLGVDGRDVVLHYNTHVWPLTLEPLDIRWRGALAAIRPKDTFTAQTWRGEHGVCLGVNSARRCGFGYTIGDGWKLIFYPEHFPIWLLSFINMAWLAGWTIGVGWWAARSGGGEILRRRDQAAAKSGDGEGAAIAWVAIVIALLGVLLVPMITGLKMTPVIEWFGAVAGLAAGWSLGSPQLGSPQFRRRSTSPPQFRAAAVPRRPWG